MLQQAGPEWASPFDTNWQNDFVPSSSPLSQSVHPAHAGTKRKLPRDTPRHHKVSSGPDRLNQCQLAYPKQKTSHPWPTSQPLSNQSHYAPKSAQLQQPPLCGTRNWPTSWVLNNPVSHAGLPQLSECSTTAGTSPASQDGGSAVSIPPSIEMASFCGPAPWSSETTSPFVSSYGHNHFHHQPCSHTHDNAGIYHSFINRNDVSHQQGLVDFSWVASNPSHLTWGGSPPMPWDCQDATPCINPNCLDGVPCSGDYMPPCNDENCDDGIPCEQAHPSIGSISLDAIDHQCEELCATQSPEGGFCCNDECPESTRCPSPCYEDCRLPPCDIDHEWPDSTWNINPFSDLCESADCLDPRYAFREDSNFDVFGTHASNDNHLSCLRETKSTLARVAPNDSFKQPGAAPAEKTKASSKKMSNFVCKNPAHNHSHSGAIIKSKPKYVSDVKPAAAFICRWVSEGDPGDPNAIICGEQHHNAEDLQMHMERHMKSLDRDPKSGNFPCLWQDCVHHRGSKGFTARPKLKRHVMTHTTSAPFRCNQCDKTMRTKDALDKHKRIHSGQKPYCCPTCPSCFATTTELKTHQTAVHSGKKPHKCKICGESFADSSNLSKHKKIHEVPKFKCPDCAFEMKRWDQMRRHFQSQKHALYILESKDAEKEYKDRMDAAFKQLTPEQRMVPLKDRQASGTRRGGRNTRHASYSSEQTPL